MEILDYHKIYVVGKHAVVLGRSNIVGMPVSHMLLDREATITICHIKTKNIIDHIKSADILVVAIGDPEFVRGNWIKEGCIVLDVGINQKKDITKKNGYRLVGDVHFEEAKEKASLITPVPGGVGPLTVASLMKNVYNSAIRYKNLDIEYSR